METADNFGRIYLFDEKFKVEYFDVDQILNMGGPLVGKITVNGTKLPGLFSGPPRISTDGKRIVLPKHTIVHSRRFFITSKTRFAILIIDTDNGDLFESKRQFRLLFIEGMKDNTVTVYEASHNQNDQRKHTLIFNKDNFEPIGQIPFNDLKPS